MRTHTSAQCMWDVDLDNETETLLYLCGLPFPALW